MFPDANARLLPDKLDHRISTRCHPVDRETGRDRDRSPASRALECNLQSETTAVLARMVQSASERKENWNGVLRPTPQAAPSFLRAPDWSATRIDTEQTPACHTCDSSCQFDPKEKRSCRSRQ